MKTFATRVVEILSCYPLRPIDGCQIVYLFAPSLTVFEILLHVKKGFLAIGQQMAVKRAVLIPNLYIDFL